MWNKKKDQKNILIVGGFYKAKSLATSLLNKRYCVTAINKDYQACEKLAELNQLKVIYGDGSKKYILEDASASSCQVVIALTDSDEENLIICEMCKKFFHVKKTVSLLKDPSKTDFFYQMGIDRVVCALNMITTIMEEQALMDEMTQMIPFDHGKIQILELPISKKSFAAGKKLWELNIPKEIIIGCILRSDQSLIPRGDTRILEGDVLLVITSDMSKINQIKEMTTYAS
ncbi:potassium channel family protein [Floccifex sp.]|uniref:potassium channel family protein n=1 Tax=Floccifex sp. TaxID=2815810 RepID=UPI003F0B9C9B